MHTESWRRSPEKLKERFEATIVGIEGLEQRQMFGYPAAFIAGNLTTSLHQDSWIVRLPEAELQACLDAGGSAFEPMPGRPMRGYAALPPDVAADPDQARDWVERAAAYVRTLPPKSPKPKTAKGAATS
jgi:TfoX/Sxy family transcriptional regulator of competence genes